MRKKVIIIGAGVGGLATACLLAKAGFDVHIYEKNKLAGGKAGQLKAKGFTFDTGPSWFLMPEVFEHFFTLLGEDMKKLLRLQRLSPSYQIYFKDTLLGTTKIYGDAAKDIKTLQSHEPHVKELLQEYIADASYKYKLAMDEFLYKNTSSKLDFLNPRMLLQAHKLNVLSNLDEFVRERFLSPEIQAILLYPAAFIGTDPKQTPALYSLLSHIDFTQGVYYPKGGMYALVETLESLAKKYGVKITYSKPVEKIIVGSSRVQGVVVSGKKKLADVVISNTDRRHTEQVLLPRPDRSYSTRFWKKQTYAPSALLMYLGVSGKISHLEHHTVVFAKEWDKKFSRLFNNRKLPKDPSFYVSMPSKTNASVAPKNHEALFVLVPVPAGLAYKDDELKKYSNEIIATMQQTLSIPGLKSRIVYKKLFCRQDFENKFNSYRGSAFGLSHTLKQSAMFRLPNQHKKLDNLLFVGADTNPGIGLPMCMISAELAYKRIINDTSSGPLKTSIS